MGAGAWVALVGLATSGDVAVSATGRFLALALAVLAATTAFVDTATMVAWHGGLGAFGVAVPALAAFRLG